ncbi:MAG: hypothetical protein KJ597_02470 [Nanoarchaeota archaeon]|nr:hypothetical protein [Nanoarchaeota archaeon]MBU1622414.1 hypothetical protein [Nanoarchaeota archaeon]
MKKEFNNLRAALEEHLRSINENSSEIQTMFDYLQETEHKIDRLNQRLDLIQLQQETEKLPLTSLTELERKIFVVLYTEEIPLSCYEIGVKANLPLAVVQESVSSLSKKSIPLVRSFVNNQVFLKLEQKFKERQAKENLVNLSLHAFMK